MGRQTTLDYVPEQHTDFIFTVAGEEFGFLGSTFVLTLFALLLWRSIRIAFLSKDPFGTYLATGVAIMFAIQMFVNIGMVIGIMPITGIPLAVPLLRRQLDAGELHRGRDPAERAHAPVQIAAGAGRPTERPANGLVETRQRNTEPWGPVSSSVTSPSIARADIRATVSPSPTPGCVRVWSSSTCSRGSKIRSSASSVDAAAVVDDPHLDPRPRLVDPDR